MDLRQQVAEHLAGRPIPFSWVPSHRNLSDATSPDDRETILRNDEVDRWAKTATALPLPPCEPTEPSAIVICGGIAPTPAKKLQRRRTFGFPGVHWVSWLPLKGTRRMLWLRWLWGNVRWEGCAPPWEKTTSLCPLCNTYHGSTAQLRLIQCPTWKLAFRKAWLGNWGEWTEYATSWYDQATHNDLVHISRLRIPQSFVNGLPRTLRPALRDRVAYHQYHLLLSVTSLHGELPMPPRCTDSSVPTASISAWFGSLRCRKNQPNPTPKNLWEQVHFSPATSGSDPDTPTPKPAPTLLVTRRIKKLLTQTPTSQNRSKAVRYLTQHPGTPYTADLKAFASLHYVHSQACFTPTCPPHHALKFPATAIADYKQFAHTLMRHRRWDMELGSRFLQYAQYTEANLLQQFYNRMWRCYSNSRTSIATSRRRIITWRRQGTLLLDHYDTLMQTCHTRKEKFWLQSLRTLRHRSMQTLTHVATQLLRENWSAAEDLFRAAVATVHHLKKRSRPYDTANPNPKRIYTPRTTPQPSESEPLWPNP